MEEKQEQILELGYGKRVLLTPKYNVKINPKYDGNQSIAIYRSDNSYGEAVIQHTIPKGFFGTSEKALSWYLEMEFLGSGTDAIHGYVHVLARYDGINDEAVGIVRQALPRLNESNVTTKEDFERPLLEKLLA